jgi:hypothetical protein
MTRSHEVPVGEWVTVPRGMVVAPDTYVDAEGVLRAVSDDSCVVWHNKGCEKRGIHASEIVYDPETNAGWCPKCWAVKRLNTMFCKGD